MLHPPLFFASISRRGQSGGVRVSRRCFALRLSRLNGTGHGLQVRNSSLVVYGASKPRRTARRISISRLSLWSRDGSALKRLALQEVFKILEVFAVNDDSDDFFFLAKLGGDGVNWRTETGNPFFRDQFAVFRPR